MSKATINGATQLLVANTAAVTMGTGCQFESLFDQSDDGILVHDANRRITYANGRIAEIVNKPLSEIIGRDCFEAFPKELACAASCLFCKSGERLKDSERSELEARVTPFRGPLGELTGAFVRLRSGKTLRDEPGILESFESSAAFLTSLDTGDFLDANSAACQRSGYSKDELLSVMSEGDEPLYNLNRIVDSGYADRRSLLVHKDGQELQTEVVSFLIRSTGESAVLSLALDPTDRGLAEDALRRSVSNLHSLLELLPVGVVVYDESGIHFANPAFVRFLGYEDDLIGQSLRNLVTKHSSEKIHQEIHELDGAIESIHFVCHDGSVRSGEVTTLPIEFNSRWMCVAIVRDMSEIVELQRSFSLWQKRNFHGIVGQHPDIRAVWNTIKAVADSPASLLVTGETGTGKELVANAVHLEGKNGTGPFITVNCGALPDGLLESELFGHVRGAFTGAYRDKRGMFELADGGTIFLDEVGELSLSTQVKLLRVLQERTIQPVGSEKTIRVDVRIISATNRDLHELLDAKLFREDLYFRLCVVPIDLPPLRERGGDVLLIARHLLEKFSEDSGRSVPKLSDGCRQRFLSWSWPGNIRELANTIQHALVMTPGDTVQIEHLPREFRGVHETRPKVGRTKKLTVEQVRAALAKVGGNKAKAARLLGVGRSTIYRYAPG